jgi:hypothetical protein
MPLSLDPNFAHRLRLSPLLKYCYLDMPKSASSTLRATLWQMEVTCGGVSIDVPEPTRHNLGVLNRPATPGGSSDSPWVAYPSLFGRTRESVFFCTFVRNPFVRTLSAYLDKMTRHDGDVHRYIFHERHRLPHDRDLDFVTFLRYLREETVQEMDGHWGVQTYMSGIEHFEFDFIGRVEAINTHLPDLIQRLAIHTERPEIENCKMFEFRPHAMDARGHFEEFYDNSECIDLVLDIFADDFRNFGFPLTIEEAFNALPPITSEQTGRGWDALMAGTMTVPEWHPTITSEIIAKAAAVSQLNSTAS